MPDEAIAHQLELALLNGVPADAGSAVLVTVVFATSDDGPLLPRSIWLLDAEALPPADSSGPIGPGDTLRVPGLYVAVLADDLLDSPSGTPFYYIRRLADPRVSLSEIVQSDGSFNPGPRSSRSGALSTHIPYPVDAGVALFEVGEGAGGPTITAIHGFIPPLDANLRPPTIPAIRLRVTP